MTTHHDNKFRLDAQSNPDFFIRFNFPRYSVSCRFPSRNDESLIAQAQIEFEQFKSTFAANFRKAGEAHRALVAQKTFKQSTLTVEADEALLADFLTSFQNEFDAHIAKLRATEGVKTLSVADILAAKAQKTTLKIEDLTPDSEIPLSQLFRDIV